MTGQRRAISLPHDSAVIKTERNHCRREGQVAARSAVLTVRHTPICVSDAFGIPRNALEPSHSDDTEVFQHDKAGCADEQCQRPHDRLLCK
jgi:hypothetical protein